MKTHHLYFFLTYLSLLIPIKHNGQDISSIKIGNQVWMSENLNVSHFQNGDPIPEAKTETEWNKAGTNRQPAWCYYNNDTLSGKFCGVLYNWYAINDIRGLAPKGWHIPSVQEWDELINFQGTNAGEKLKSKTSWKSYTTGGSKVCPNCESWSKEYRSKVPCHTCKDNRKLPAPEIAHSGKGSNSSGLTGLPCGKRNLDGLFLYFNFSCVWWTSTELNINNAYCISLSSYFNYANKSNYPKKEGYSVRCIKN